MSQPKTTPEAEKKKKPEDQWAAEKNWRNERVNQLRSMKSKTLGQIQLLQEDVEKITAELAGISGEMSGGDLLLSIMQENEKEGT